MIDDSKWVVLSINISQKQIKNAVRDVVNELLSPEAAKASFDHHVEKQKQKVAEHAEKELAKVEIPKTTLDKWIARKLDRELDSKILEAVKLQTMDLVREEVEIAIEHIVKTGISIEIGRRWGNKVTLKTKERPEEAS